MYKLNSIVSIVDEIIFTMFTALNQPSQASLSVEEIQRITERNTKIEQLLQDYNNVQTPPEKRDKIIVELKKYRAQIQSESLQR